MPVQSAYPSGPRAGGLATKEQPPKNKLLRILYELERATLSPIAGIAEELKFQEEHPSAKDTNLIKAAIDGYKKHKTFNDVVDDPWLAFAMNVGFDPITWVPGAAYVKLGKGFAKYSKLAKGWELAQDVSAVRKTTEIIGKGTEFLGKRFVAGHMGRKFNPKQVQEAMDEYLREYAKFTQKYGEIPELRMYQMVPRIEDQVKLQSLISQTAPGRNLIDSMQNVPKKVVDEYLASPDNVKLAYRYAIDHIKEMEKHIKSYNYVAYDTMQKFTNQFGYHLPLHLRGSIEDVAMNTHVNYLLAAAKEHGIDYQELAKLSPNLTNHYKPLGGVALKAKTMKEFKKQTIELAKKGRGAKLGGKLQAKNPELFAQARVAEELLEDQAIRTVQQYARQLADDGVEDIAGEMARKIQNKRQHIHLKAAVARLTHKKIKYRPVIKKNEQYVLADLVSEKHIFPKTSDMVELLTRRPKTEYKTLNEFYTKSRSIIRGLEMPLEDAIKASPPPGIGLGGINVARLNRDAIEGVRRMDPTGRAYIDHVFQSMKSKPGFSFKSKVREQLIADRKIGPNDIVSTGDVARMAGLHAELEAGKLLGIQGRALGAAMARDNYIKRMFKVLDDQGFLFTPDDFATPAGQINVANRLTKNLGEKKAKRHLLGEFVEIKHKAFFNEKTGEYFRVPKIMAADIEQVLKVTGTPEFTTGFMKHMAKALGIWKAHTLSIFPQYHIRNFISNVYNNYLAGFGSNPLYIKRDFEFYRKAVTLQRRYAQRFKDTVNLTDEEIRIFKELEENSILGGFYQGEIGAIRRQSATLKNMLHPRIIWRPKDNFWVQHGFHYGRQIEDNARIAHYLWARSGKGLSAKEAAKSVRKYLFDYQRGLTGFETKYFRNFLFPFYSWTRFNLPLQLEVLLTNPGRLSRVYKGINAIEETFGGPDPDETFMAEWMQKAMNVRWRYNKDKKTYEYFLLDNWLPSADINKVLSLPILRDTLVGMTSPGIKLPIEIFFNHDLFRKREISEYPGQFKEIHYTKTKSIKVSAAINHLLRSIRLINDVDRFLMMQSEISPYGATARFILGKSYPYSAEKQKPWWIRSTNARIADLKGHLREQTKKNNMGEVRKIEKKIKAMEEVRDYYK